MQKLWVRYAKRGRARFTSHRDFSRAFERALRRAGVPMAYSSGFNPHPRISYANASPTGAATEAEYLEIGLAQPRDPDAVRDALDSALPQGLDVLQVVVATAGSLADGLDVSEWRMSIGGPDAGVTESAVRALLDRDALEVERMTKSGLRTFDARAAIIALWVVDEHTLGLVSRHGVPLVRPDDVLQALGRVEPRFELSQPALLTRLDQGRWNGDRIVGPFDEQA